MSGCEEQPTLDWLNVSYHYSCKIHNEAMASGKHTFSWSMNGFINFKLPTLILELMYLSPEALNGHPAA